MSDPRVQRFMSLFQGGRNAHGTLKLEKGGPGQATTAPGPAEERQFLEHLNGIKGLGIVPVDDQGLSWYGLIDVDSHEEGAAVDHLALEEWLRAQNIPGIVTQTRRMGAHIYFFLADPLPSSLLITWLKNIAAKVAKMKFGDPIEVFPKQSKLQNGQAGNWVNLPYLHGMDAGKQSRFAIHHGQPLTLEEFLDLAERKKLPADALGPVTEIPRDHDEAPPCIQQIFAEGLGTGSRNNAIYAIGVYLRKRGIVDEVQHANVLKAINREICKPPMPAPEVMAISGRSGGTTANYPCMSAPICDMCDKETCNSRAYGHNSVGAGGGIAAQSVLDVVDQLVKLMTDPPQYEVRFKGGTKMTILSEDLFMYPTFQRMAFDATGVLMPDLKPRAWKLTIDLLNSRREERSAPNSANASALVEQALADFCNPAQILNDDLEPKVQKDFEGAAMGRPICAKDPDTGVPRVYFQGAAFLTYLQRKRVAVSPQDVWRVLQSRGCTHEIVEIRRVPTELWSKPFVAYIPPSYDLELSEEKF